MLDSVTNSGCNSLPVGACLPQVSETTANPVNMNLLETLRQFPDFKLVPDEQLQWFIERAEEVTYPEETIIYKPNESADYLILLLEGRVRIETGANGTGDERVMHAGLQLKSGVKTAMNIWPRRFY